MHKDCLRRYRAVKDRKGTETHPLKLAQDPDNLQKLARDVQYIEWIATRVAQVRGGQEVEWRTIDWIGATPTQTQRLWRPLQHNRRRG